MLISFLHVCISIGAIILCLRNKINSNVTLIQNTKDDIYNFFWLTGCFTKSWLEILDLAPKRVLKLRSLGYDYRFRVIQENCQKLWKTSIQILSKYRTRAIISRGLFIFYPIFKDHFFVFKEVFYENSVLMYGLYSWAASNQERLMMARVRYINFYY